MVLLLVGVGCGAGFAALAVYGQVRGGVRLRKVDWAIPTGILVVAGLLGVGAHWLDSGIARTTLFEVDADGSTGVVVGAPAPVREFDIHVEHPGVEHERYVSPITGDSGPPRRPTANAHPGTDPRGCSATFDAFKS